MTSPKWSTFHKTQRHNSKFCEVSGARLDVGPLVLRPTVRWNSIGCRVVGEVAEPFELHDLAGLGVGQGGFDLAVGEQLARVGLRSSSGSPVASPGTSAENSRSYSATVPATACAADTQCIVDLTLRPSGALPPACRGRRWRRPGDVAVVVGVHAGAGDEVGAPQPHLAPGRQPEELRRRLDHEVVALDNSSPLNGDGARAVGRVLGVVGDLEVLDHRLPSASVGQLVITSRSGRSTAIRRCAVRLSSLRTNDSSSSIWCRLLVRATPMKPQNSRIAAAG